MIKIFNITKVLQKAAYVLLKNVRHKDVKEQRKQEGLFLQKRVSRLILACILCTTLSTQTICAATARLETNEISTPEGPLIWPEFRQKLEIPYNEQRESIQKQIKFYQKHKHFFYTVLENAAPYIAYIYQQTRNRDLPSELALVPFIESGFNPLAYSKAGAVGLWQLMPGTATVFGLNVDWWYDERRDIITSTKAGLDYLSYLCDFFDNDWILAVAAYDSGEGTVQNALKQNMKQHKSISFWNLQLPKETKDYLPKLLAVVSIIKHPERYNMKLPPIVKADYFKRVTVADHTHLPKIAQITKINLETLYYLNPGFRRVATGPKGSFTLLLPNNKTTNVEQKLQQLSGKNAIEWHRYHIKKGDALSKIAKRFHTTVSVLKDVNQLKKDFLKINQEILVPNSYEVALVKALSANKRKTIEGDHQPGPKHYVHTVHKYDTFSTLAKHYQVKISEIKRWNKLNYKHTLKQGEKIVIWSKRKFTRKQLVYEKHKVRQGDNLIILAKHYRTSVNEIKKVNKLNNNIIIVGKTLKIPSHIDIST